MKYFLHTIKGIFKKPSQIKTKPLSKRGKLTSQKGWGSPLKGLFWKKFFCYFFLSSY